MYMEKFIVVTLDKFFKKMHRGVCVGVKLNKLRKSGLS
jgi:hypothetical protein